MEPKTFCISEWKDWRFVSPSCSSTATLRHLCAPLMHIAQRLNLIINMLNQGSSCENSLSYPWSSPATKYIYNCLVIIINMNVVNLWPNKWFDLIWSLHKGEGEVELLLGLCKNPINCMSQQCFLNRCFNAVTIY